MMKPADRRPPEGVVKVEQPLLGLDPQEGGHVLKVGQRGRQAHQPHHLLGGLRQEEGCGMVQGSERQEGAGR